jgi:hypothetical protein
MSNSLDIIGYLLARVFLERLAQRAPGLHTQACAHPLKLWSKALPLDSRSQLAEGSVLALDEAFEHEQGFAATVSEVA